jgi:hypothetical protein
MSSGDIDADAVRGREERASSPIEGVARLPRAGFVTPEIQASSSSR